MISSVTVTKFGTVRMVAVGVCPFPVVLKTHNRAALSRDFLIKYLITPSLGISDQLAWFVVFGSLPCHRRDSHARSLAPIVPHCRIGYNGDAAMPAHRCFPRAPQHSGLRGTRSGPIAATTDSAYSADVSGNGEPRSGDLMMSKTARAVVVVGAGCLTSVLGAMPP